MAKPYVPYDGPIVTRKEAIELGLVRYFTGKPCKRGHMSQRTVSGRSCETCSYLQQKSNPEKRSETLKRFYHKHRVSELARGVEYRKKNTEKIREKNKRQYWADPEKSKAKSVAWQKANPERMKAINATKLANRISRMSGDKYSAKDVRDIGSKQNWKCGNCKIDVSKDYHVDHVMPLALGGRNIKSNLEILCPKCNMRKKAKHPIDWALQNGRLV